jgi:hypothetical protein
LAVFLCRLLLYRIIESKGQIRFGHPHASDIPTLCLGDATKISVFRIAIARKKLFQAYVRFQAYDQHFLAKDPWTTNFVEAIVNIFHKLRLELLEGEYYRPDFAKFDA